MFDFFKKLFSGTEDAATAPDVPVVESAAPIIADNPGGETVESAGTLRNEVAQKEASSRHVQLSRGGRSQYAPRTIEV